MQAKIVIMSILVLLISFSKAFSQNFNQSTDLLLANYDLRADEDDVMAAAALACMLRHPNYTGVNYYAVAGAYGTQNSPFITAAVPDYFNHLFGAENTNWTNADADWDASVTRVKNKVKAVLNAGGKVFIAEAGQSDFSYDMLQAVIADGVSLSTVQANVNIVQHSTWNQRMTTSSKLDWVKDNTVYTKIPHANLAGNGTPGYKSNSTSHLAQATSAGNTNASARTIWTLADELCQKWTLSGNSAIQTGGVDFSDCVENWYIFNLGSEFNTGDADDDIAAFWNAFLVREDVGVFHNSSVPQLAFAAGDVKSALEKRGLTAAMKELSDLSADYTGRKVVIALQSDAAALNLMTTQGGEAVGVLGDQAYALRTTGANADISCWVIGGDANGAMYGGLQVAETITFSGLKGLRSEEDAPYIERRGIKFNIPLDVRNPSFSDKGDAAKTNIKHMWDMSFWTEYFDVLARHRYNVISFWSKHPFTCMVKVPGYEDAVIEDVRDHDGLVKTMSIEEKIRFWQDVMQLAHNRGFEIYFINWNIFTSGASGKYGISNSRTNQATIDYTRKSVYQFLKTYPLLTGIGVSAGENFGDASFAQREEWLYATFGEALWDYYREDPDRDITFIHRYLDSGVGSIMAEFKNLPQKYRIDISFKYTLGHLYTYHAPTYIYKTQDTKENVVAQLETYHKKCWMNLRNDDLFYLRWGSPDYVRNYLTNFPEKEKYVAGYYMGSDGYVWGRVFSSENALFQGDLEVNKHWYRFMLWGRLGYNPKLPDSVFVNTIAARFGQEQAQHIFDAWNGGSKAFTAANSLIWWLWDGWWYPEGSKRAQGWRDVNDFINTSPPQGAPVYSIKEYKNRLNAGDPMEKKTPLEVAAEIRAYANTALGTVIRTGDNEELRLVSNDIKALGYLGLYFAEKIEAAVYHHLGQKSKAISHMQNAYWHWKSYTEIGDAMYKDQRLARTGMFRWGDYDDDAIDDIKTVGGSGPGDKRVQHETKGVAQ